MVFMFWANLVYSTALVFFNMLLFFSIAMLDRNNAAIDMAWSLGFMLVALTTIIRTGTYEPRQMLATTLVLIWGFRMTLYLFFRTMEIKGLKGFRYKATKGPAAKRAKKPDFRDVAQGFLSQVVLMLIVLLPLILINSTMDSTLTALDMAGTSLWLVGFFFQAVADLQVYLFKRNPKNTDKILTTGLWKFSRHPNYFGEVCMWWGIWLMALAVPGGIYTVVGPLTITYLLLHVSGVPMAEEAYKGNREYQKYKKRTSKFLPWFPKAQKRAKRG